jgi:signal transduction histidine kinase
MTTHPLVLAVFALATAVSAVHGWIAVSSMLHYRRNRLKIQLYSFLFTSSSALFSLMLALSFVPMAAPSKVQIFRLMWVFGLAGFASWIRAVASLARIEDRLLQGIERGFLAMLVVPLVDLVQRPLSGRSFFYSEQARESLGVLLAHTGNVQTHNAVTNTVALLTTIGLVTATVRLSRHLHRKRSTDWWLRSAVVVTGVCAILEVVLAPLVWSVPLLFLANLMEAARLGWVNQLRAAEQLQLLRRSHHEQTALISHQLSQLALAERMSHVGSRTAEISHDLRNPLTTVMMGVEYLEALLDETGQAPDPAELKDVMSSVRLSSQHALALLQTITRQARTGTDSPPEELPLVRVLQDARRICLAPGDVEFRFHVEPTVQVFGVHAELVQIFVNLFSNSVQAISSEEDGWVAVQAREAGGRVDIEVTDAGLRPPDAVLRKMFATRFTTKSEGTGLGLGICRRIVEGGGGQIWVDRRRIHTTVCLSLPQSVQTAGARSQRQAG